MRLPRPIGILAVLVLVFGLAACDSVRFNSENSTEGIQPWARPESWESQRGLGGMFPYTR